MNEVQPIKNYSAYNERMELAMMDKLFWADKIDAELVVDFGCADGSLLKAIRKLKPSLPIIGFDTDPEMVRRYSSKETPITTLWDSILEMMQGLPSMHYIDRIRKGETLPAYPYTTPTKKTALVLSSVIHEVYHYGSKADIDDFWKNVFFTVFE